MDLVFKINEKTLGLWAQEGDEKAFMQFKKANLESLYNFGVQYFCSGEVADRFVTEVFDAVWKDRKKFTTPRILDFYLRTLKADLGYKYLLALANEIVAQKEELIYKESSSLPMNP